MRIFFLVVVFLVAVSSVSADLFDFGNYNASCTQGCSSSCTDTDGGKNYYVIGTVYGNYSNGQHFNFTDSCTSGTQLLEWYCKDDNCPYPWWEIHNCEFGCSAGKCDHDIPEFGAMAALLALAGAVTTFFVLRKR